MPAEAAGVPPAVARWVTGAQVGGLKILKAVLISHPSNKSVGKTSLIFSQRCLAALSWDPAL